MLASVRKASIGLKVALPRVPTICRAQRTHTVNVISLRSRVQKSIWHKGLQAQACMLSISSIDLTGSSNRPFA